MSYPRSPPQSPDDWKSRGLLSKTFSTSSSRSNNNYSSRAPSMASSTNRPYNNNVNYETTARTYYVELRKYLIHFLAKEATEGVHPQRTSARQKLSRLSNLQFHELAMDVYDELMRRNLNDKFVPFLAVREEFHPKRNQARQKLATLPDSRFMDLSSDVYYELTRRYPHIMDSDDTNRPPMPPLPTTSTSSPTPRHPMSNNVPPPASQSTTIIPTKGTINVEPVSSKDSSDEDDDDNTTKSSGNTPIGKYASSTQHKVNDRMPPTSGTAGYQRKQSLTSQSITPSSSSSHYQQHNKGKEGDSLNGLMADLGNRGFNRSQDTINSYDNNKMPIGDREKRPDDYDNRIASMNKQIEMLEKENQELRANALSRGNTDVGGNPSQLQKLQEDYSRLDKQYKSLERNHNDQQEIIREVKQEAGELMNELEKLSNENDKFRKDIDQSESTARQLTQQIQDWKTKYQKLRLELRNTNASSDYDNTIPNQDITRSHFLQASQSGVISHDSVISYQAAIEDLLRRARSNTPSDVLNSMKTIVMTCKSMTEDVERYEMKGLLNPDKQTKLQALKGPFSNELAHLVTAAKTHVNSMGISPVALLDVAASNLTNAVVNLVKLMGMSATASSSPPIDEKSPDHSTTHPTRLPLTSPSSAPHTLYQQQQQQKPSSSTSVNGSDNMVNTLTPSQLAEYLKKETDQIVTSVQSLLGALRSAQRIDQVHGIITNIVDVVTMVMDTSKSSFATTRDSNYRQQGDVILSDLEQCRDKLVYIRNRSFAHHPESASSSAKRDLAKESYEIAKFIKELIVLCEA
ncbi:hypothetical protein BC941DRAFT_469332 [Chlamydoabsidia padenii]|nr:hypothetical protein BC941DRAFT_469332 [Chlamydoabsidia padenii]